jgi:hypothetical protein
MKMGTACRERVSLPRMPKSFKRDSFSVSGVPKIATVGPSRGILRPSGARNLQRGWFYKDRSPPHKRGLRLTPLRCGLQSNAVGLVCPTNSRLN